MAVQENLSGILPMRGNSALILNITPSVSEEKLFNMWIYTPFRSVLLQAIDFHFISGGLKLDYSNQD